MTERTCQADGCETPIVRKGERGRQPKWCSVHKTKLQRDPTRNRSSRARLGAAVRWRAAREANTDPCVHCGGANPRAGAYCSEKCNQRAYYLRRKEAGTAHWQIRPLKPKRPVGCAQCGEEFLSARKDARFCSRKCLSRWTRNHETGECATKDCPRPVRAKGLCANHYKAQARKEGWTSKEPWNDRRRDNYHRRRALKKAAATGRPVIRDEIAARDGYRCGICSSRVDMAKVWPHPMSPSLDHVVPLTKGGAHDPSNVQLAHLRCNSAKGNRGGGEQLMLIG